VLLRPAGVAECFAENHAQAILPEKAGQRKALINKACLIAELIGNAVKNYRVSEK